MFLPHVLQIRSSPPHFTLHHSAAPPEQNNVCGRSAPRAWMAVGNGRLLNSLTWGPVFHSKWGQTSLTRALSLKKKKVHHEDLSLASWSGAAAPCDYKVRSQRGEDRKVGVRKAASAHDLQQLWITRQSFSGVNHSWGSCNPQRQPSWHTM